MNNRFIAKSWLVALAVLLLLTVTSIRASSAAEKKRGTAAPAPEAPAAAATPASEGLAEKVNVESIKEKYWAQGNESDLGVVQNRLYSKANKIEVGLFSGVAPSDPFLNVVPAGASVGFHLSEYFAIHALGWRSFSADSSAIAAFRQAMENPEVQVNNNVPRSFFGLELAASPIYGKLSFLGKRIIYYDLHVAAGGGLTYTENGNYFTPFLGIGQQIYLSKWSSFRVDYRPMYYREAIVEKTNKYSAGTFREFRTHWTHAITVGVTFLVGFGGGL